MKSSKGFTLIELLAVIVILAIIALIAAPVILGIIDDARKSAAKDSAYGVIESAKLHFAQTLMDTDEAPAFYTEEGEDREFSCDGTKCISVFAVGVNDVTITLSLDGEIPVGYVNVTDDGVVYSDDPTTTAVVEKVTFGGKYSFEIKDSKIVE